MVIKNVNRSVLCIKYNECNALQDSEPSTTLALPTGLERNNSSRCSIRFLS